MLFRSVWLTCVCVAYVCVAYVCVCTVTVLEVLFTSCIQFCGFMLLSSRLLSTVRVSSEVCVDSERLYPARPPWSPAVVCRLASYPIGETLLDPE